MGIERADHSPDRPVDQPVLVDGVHVARLDVREHPREDADVLVRRVSSRHRAGHARRRDPPEVRGGEQGDEHGDPERSRGTHEGSLANVRPGAGPKA